MNYIETYSGIQFACLPRSIKLVCNSIAYLYAISQQYRLRNLMSR